MTTTSSAPRLRGRTKPKKEIGKSKIGIEKHGREALLSKKEEELFSANNKDDSFTNPEPSASRKLSKSASSSSMLGARKKTRLTPISTTSPISNSLLPTPNPALHPPTALPIPLHTNRRLATWSRNPYLMNKMAKRPNASLGTSVAMSRVDPSKHRLPRRLLEDVTYTASRQNIRKNGITATSVGCGRSGDVIIPITRSANLSRDRHRWTTKKLRTTWKEGRGGSGVCGEGRGLDIHEDEVGFPSTTEQSSLHDEKAPSPILKLRGGAGSANGDGKDTKSKRLEDDERVPALVWYFAGNKGPPPTGKQLRARRAKERGYIQRKQAEANLKKEERQAKKARKDAIPGSLWKNPFGKKKKTVKLRGDEEGKDKEVADGNGEPEPDPGETEAQDAAG